jgi:hypothetical protein
MSTGKFKMVDGELIELTPDELAPEPTEKELAAAEAAQALELCFMNRQAEYGALTDQLDEMFHDFDAWKARIQAVKDANPKPE